MGPDDRRERAGIWQRRDIRMLNAFQRVSFSMYRTLFALHGSE